MKKSSRDPPLRNPSSIGITTCFGKKAETHFIVDVNFSRYESKKFDKESKTRTWQRTPYTIQEIFSRERIHNGTQKIKFEVCPWVELSISRRKSRLDDKIRMTATITNTFEFDESSESAKIPPFFSVQNGLSGNTPPVVVVGGFSKTNMSFINQLFL